MGVSHSMNQAQVDQVLSQFEATTAAIKGIETKVGRVHGYVRTMREQRVQLTRSAEAAKHLLDSVSNTLNHRSDEVLEYFQQTLDSFAGPVEQFELTLFNLGLQDAPRQLQRELGPLLIPAVVLVAIITVSNTVFGFMLAADERLAKIFSVEGIAGTDRQEAKQINILNIFAIAHVASLGAAVAYLVSESIRRILYKRLRRRRGAVGFWATLGELIGGGPDDPEEEDEDDDRPASAPGWDGEGNQVASQGQGVDGLVPCSQSPPVVGDQVTPCHGAVSARDAEGARRAWHLAPGEHATVIEVDGDGDFRLRNPQGVESGWVQREAFAALPSGWESAQGPTATEEPHSHMMQAASATVSMDGQDGADEGAGFAERLPQGSYLRGSSSPSVASTARGRISVLAGMTGRLSARSTSSVSASSGPSTTTPPQHPEHSAGPSSSANEGRRPGGTSRGGMRRNNSAGSSMSSLSQGFRSPAGEPKTPISSMLRRLQEVSESIVETKRASSNRAGALQLFPRFGLYGGSGSSPETSQTVADGASPPRRLSFSRGGTPAGSAA